MKTIHWVLLIGVLFLASFLRLFRISDYMTFLGDEGRDVLIVKHLLEGDLVGLGPTASVGGFFTGPIYYYMMAPFLWLFRLDPTGPALMVALFGIATVLLVFWVGKTFFSLKAGLFAAALYSISPLIIAYSRSSWNPNPLPFFSLLAIWFLFKGMKEGSFRYFFFVGVVLGIALQLHYIATFLIIALGLYLLILGFLPFARFVKRAVLFLFGFIVGYSPFLAFEVTHGFPNTQTVLNFAFGGTGETGFTGERFFTIVLNVMFRLFGRLLTRYPPPEQITLGIDRVTAQAFGISLPIPVWFLFIATILLAVSSLYLLFSWLVHAQKQKQPDAFVKASLLVIWLVVGVVLFGFYKKPIYDYYFGFLFPLPFLLVGNLLAKLHNASGRLSIIVFVLLMLLNLDGISFRNEPNRQYMQVKNISEFVLDKAEGKPFNFALITQQNSDHGYRYFFELAGNSPVTIHTYEADPKRETVANQLLIVCEDISCRPLGHSLWEVAGFGRAEIVGQWDVSVVKVYKLVHYQGE